MNFNGYSGGRTSAFYSPECPSDRVKVASFFESADTVVYQAMMDSMCATYQAVACDDMSIAMEGLGDMAKSAWNFFKKIISKIVTFVKNTFDYIMSYIGDFEKFIEKHKDNINFKDFEVSGYTYTITADDVDTGAISAMVDEYNSKVKTIKDMEVNAVQEYISKELSKDKISEIRGKLCVNSSVKADRFTDALKKKYRDGKNSLHTIKVNTSNIHGFIDDFKNMKKTLESIREDSSNVTGALDDMADFFKSMPQYEYKSSDRKEITHSKVGFDKEKGASIETQGEGIEYSSENYKKLAMFYNFCFRMTKELASIYTRAYTEKVSAAKEAISFYRSIIRQALSPFADKKEADKLKASKESAELIFDPSEAQRDFARNCSNLAFVATEGFKDGIIGTVRERDAYRGEATPGEIRIRAREAVAEASIASDKYNYKLSYVSESAVTTFAIKAELKNRKPVQEAEIVVAQNLMETVNESNDYGLDFDDAISGIAFEKYVADFKQYVNEIDVMAEAFHTGAVYLGDMVLEDVKVINSAGQNQNTGDEGFFSSIISFIKNIINKFVEAAKGMISSNEEWFEENNWKVKELIENPSLFNNISFTIIAYNSEFFDKKYIHNVKFIYKNAIEAKQTIDFAKMSRQMYPDMTKLSKNGDIAEGAKIFFRGKSNNVVQYTGGDAHKRFQVMANYCENYKSYVQNIQDILDSVTSQMEDAESKLNEELTKESFGVGLISEREPIHETMLSLMPWYGESGVANMIAAMEATPINNGKVTAGEGDDPPPKDTNPNEQKTEAEKAKEAEEKKAAKDANVAKRTNAKTFFQVKVKVATAMLTIAEEQYAAYVKTIKGVVMAKGDALKKQGEEKKAAKAQTKKK